MLYLKYRAGDGRLHTDAVEGNFGCAHTSGPNITMNPWWLVDLKTPHFIANVTITTGANPGFGRGGPQLPRPKVAHTAEQSCVSEASYLWQGSRAHLRALEAFGFLMLKYAFSTF